MHVLKEKRRVPGKQTGKQVMDERATPPLDRPQALRLLARDIFYGCLLLIALCVWWLLGHTWHFWPLWVAVGMAVAFVLRAASENIWIWGNAAQNKLESLLGSWGAKRVRVIEKTVKHFFEGRWWPTQPKRALKSASVKEQPKAQSQPGKHAGAKKTLKPTTKKGNKEKAPAKPRKRAIELRRE